MRRTYVELDARVKGALERFGKKGTTIREIAIKSKVNWRTTRNILEKFERLGISENIFTHSKLKIYRIKKWV